MGQAPAATASGASQAAGHVGQQYSWLPRSSSRFAGENCPCLRTCHKHAMGESTATFLAVIQVEVVG